MFLIYVFILFILSFVFFEFDLTESIILVYTCYTIKHYCVLCVFYVV